MYIIRSRTLLTFLVAMTIDNLVTSCVPERRCRWPGRHRAFLGPRCVRLRLCEGDTSAHVRRHADELHAGGCGGNGADFIRPQQGISALRRYLLLLRRSPGRAADGGSARNAGLEASVLHVWNVPALQIIVLHRIALQTLYVSHKTRLKSVSCIKLIKFFLQTMTNSNTWCVSICLEWKL